MDSCGKIYIVVAVLGLILIGIFIYLMVMDRKLARFEKEINNIKQDKEL